jgi:putative transposase
MKKVVPSERLRRELDDVLAGIGEVEDPVEAVARLGARLILQQALEDEVSEFVGRGRYERVGGGEVIYRNGFQEPSTVRTTSGPAVVERPRVRDASRVGFESELLGKGVVARTHALEALIVCSFLRGLSVRDVEAAPRSASVSR